MQYNQNENNMLVQFNASYGVRCMLCCVMLCNVMLSNSCWVMSCNAMFHGICVIGNNI